MNSGRGIRKLPGLRTLSKPSKRVLPCTLPDSLLQNPAPGENFNEKTSVDGNQKLPRCNSPKEAHVMFSPPGAMQETITARWVS